MRAEDEPARNICRIDIDGVVRGRTEVRVTYGGREPRVDRDDVGFLADLDRPDPVVQPECLRAGERPRSEERRVGKECRL